MFYLLDELVVLMPQVLREFIIASVKVLFVTFSVNLDSLKVFSIYYLFFLLMANMIRKYAKKQQLN